MKSRVKTNEEIKALRASGQMLAKVLNIVAKHVHAGQNTKALADLAKNELKSLGGKPAFLGYQGFPDVICTSVNDEVVHGIPSQQKILKEGDIIGLDFGVEYNGMITDAAITVPVGQISGQAQKLLQSTKASLYLGIEQVKPGCHVGDIGWAVQNYLEKHGLGVVRELVGHGVGHNLHEEPNIPNYGMKGSGPVLDKNMTIAIEPMSTLGDRNIYIKEDGWTVATKDGNLAAHFEHTILITDTGVEVLTLL